MIEGCNSCLMYQGTKCKLFPEEVSKDLNDWCGQYRFKYSAINPTVTIKVRGPIEADSADDPSVIIVG